MSSDGGALEALDRARHVHLVGIGGAGVGHWRSSSWPEDSSSPGPTWSRPRIWRGSVRQGPG